MNRNLLKKVLKPINRMFSKIHWNGFRALFNGGIYYDLTETDHNLLHKILADNNYIILTYRKSHLTTWLIGILSLIKQGKWPKYVHALMNVDNVTDYHQWEQYKFMEATNVGVHWTTFMKVFDCDHVCILKPKSISSDDWTIVIERLLKQEGKKYDNLFDLADDKQLSCVELCRIALQADPNYEIEFANFEKMIKNIGNLTPQMFRDCPDFEIILEICR